MPLTAIALALASALIHASWNALLKSGRDRLADSAMVGIGWCVLGGALIAWKGMPPDEAWPFLLISGSVHALYWTGLTKGYEAGDLSHVYTLSRGLAPAVVALGAFVFARETPSALALAGIACVCAGVLAVGASPSAPLRATLWALLTALSIGTYSLADALGARVSGDAVLYLGWSVLLSALPIILFALWRRGAGLLRDVRADWARGIAAGVVSGAGYGIVLVAQTLAPVAQVTALRETSVVFGALIAWIFLREALGLRRWIGALVVAAGALMIGFG